MRKEMKLFRNIVLIATWMMTGSCVMEDPVVPSVDESPIEFSASKMRVITKAGDSAEPFADGTKFRLFAVEDSGAEHNWSNTVLYDRPGEVSSGLVSYGEKVSYGVEPLNVLDFYGVTYGDKSDVTVSGSGSDVPKVAVSQNSDGSLPDLMYSDNLKAKTSASGRLQMEFRHAMAKLIVEILKQDESADPDADKKLENAVLTKIVLKGTGVSGTFNIETGSWESVSQQSEGLTIFNGSHAITKDVQTIVSDLLVIPEKEESVSLRIYLEGVDGGKEYVDYTLTVDEGVNLHLEQNHEYTLSVAVLKNDVRIVTVTPKVYEWVDVELDTGDAYFGQPVYFGGLMWMDRNLGAKSADCENDWYNTIGYYYQFGRNIPYMVDVDAYLNDSKKSWTFTPDRDATDPDAVFTMKFIYTLDDTGKRVTTAKHANNSSGNCLYDNVAINPGDPGEYSYIRGYIYENSKGAYTLNNKSWAKQYLDLKNSNDAIPNGSFDNHVFWQTIENQPCPKGWRLPGKSDMFSFMPESTKLFWLDTYNLGDYLDRGYDTNNDGKVNTDDTNQANFVSGNENAAGQEYQWKYFAGKFVIGSSSDKSEDYSYPEKDKEGNGRVYGIKYEGEDKAYRVMVEQRLSTYSGRKYVRISRFEAKADDRFELSPDCRQWNIHKFDWETPVEYMDIPLAGFMYESGMADFGGGTILRAVEGDGNGTNWTLYLRSGHNGIAVGGNSRRILGENIRCVRDVNAK